MIEFDNDSFWKLLDVLLLIKGWEIKIINIF